MDPSRRTRPAGERYPGGRDGDRLPEGHQHLAEQRLQIYRGGLVERDGLDRDSGHLLEWSVDLAASVCLPSSEDADEQPCLHET